MLNEERSRQHIDDFYKQLDAEGYRDDTDKCHVSDLYGCARAVWARRNMQTLEPKGPDTLRLFRMGHLIEKDILDALAIPAQDRNVLVALTASFDIVGHELSPDMDLNAMLAEYTIGHIDAVDRDMKLVIEVKSTNVGKNRAYKTVMPHDECEFKYEWRLQAATYALAMGYQHARIICVDRGTLQVAVLTFDVEPYRNAVYRRLLRTNPATMRNAPMPPADPPDETRTAYGSTIAPGGAHPDQVTRESWLCKGYCDFLACPANGRRKA